MTSKKFFSGSKYGEKFFENSYEVSKKIDYEKIKKHGTISKMNLDNLRCRAYYKFKYAYLYNNYAKPPVWSKYKATGTK